MEALSDIYDKCWLYLISLRHLLDSLLDFDFLNLNPYVDHLELKSFHISNNRFRFNMYIMIL